LHYGWDQTKWMSDGADRYRHLGLALRLMARAFLPGKAVAKHQLRYYASQFETTELNGVFYRTPTEAAVKGWRAETGNDFVFAWKASKFITHWKRLSNKSASSIELLDSRYKLLAKKGGPVLFQLPPNFTEDLDRLKLFVRMLPRKWRVTFEFRHPSWYRKPVFEFLSQRNICALHLGSLRRAGAMATDGGFHLHSRPRTGRPLQGSLHRPWPRRLGAPYTSLEQRRLRCVCLF
jgi:hypothetical protein